MATAIQPNPSVAVTDALGKAQRDWLNYWSSIAANASGTSAANPTATIGLTAVNGSATTFMRSDGASALSQAIAPDWTGIHDWVQGASTVLSINPTAGGVAKVIKLLPLSNYQAITANQTVSGLSAAWAGSDFTVTDATAFQNFGPLNARINVLSGWGNQKVCFSTAAEVSGARGASGGPVFDIVGHGNNTYATGQVSAVPDLVSLFGFNHLCWTGPSGTNVWNLIGGEIDIACHASAPSQGRVGLFLASTTVPIDGSAGVQGSAGVNYDNALVIGAMTTAAKWGHGVMISDFAGAYPFDGTSTVMGSLPGTCGWGIDFQHITFTQFAFLSPGFSVDPDGDVVAKSFNSTSGLFKSNGTQVVGGRGTGWSLMSGTTTKGGFDTATVTLPQLAAVVNALVAAGFTHGLIGA